MADENANAAGDKSHYSHFASGQQGHHTTRKPGNQQGHEAAPEFHAKSYPAGTAPEENSFRPHPSGGGADLHADPLDMPGVTSRDIYNMTDAQHGHPIQGQSSRELHSAHAGRNKKEHSGLEGVGANAPRSESAEGVVRAKVADIEGVGRGERGHTGSREGGMLAGGAEAAEPVSAEERTMRHGKHA